jgi:hypothetical protein
MESTTAGATRRQRLVLVLGMHRSGTSAMACALQTMGVNFGDHLAPPKADVNAKGFYEDIDLRSFNDRLDEALGATIYGASIFTPEQLQALCASPLFDEAVTLLRAKIGSDPLFGFKEPKMVRLLPFWSEVFKRLGVSVSYLIALRNPKSVADSLAKRDQILPAYAYLMWLTHTMEALRHSQGHRRVLVDFDALMDEPARHLRLIADALHLRLDHDAATTYCDEFLSTELRHTRHEVSTLAEDPDCLDLVRACYTVLKTFSGNAAVLNSAGFDQRVARWVADNTRLAPIHALVDRQFHSFVRACTLLLQRNGQVRDLQATLARTIPAAECDPV